MIVFLVGDDEVGEDPSSIGSPIVSATRAEVFEAIILTGLCS